MLEIGLLRLYSYYPGGTHQVSSHTVAGRIANFNVCFRSDCLSSHAGLVLVKDFVDRLGVASLINAEVQVKQRRRGYSEAEAVLGLVYNLLAGGDCLSDLNVLRGDPGTRHLLGVEQVIAPTTAGEHLRKFRIGDIHDLHRTNRLLQERVRAEQDTRVCTIDADSSMYEQASSGKEGSCTAYNGEIGDHPLFAFWDETGELLYSQLRRGSAYTAAKAESFLDEVEKRVPRGARKKLRADSGFYSRGVVNWCERHATVFGITADQTQPLLKKIEELKEAAWEDLERYGVAQVAEVCYQPTGWAREYRYVVKREVREKKTGELYFHYHVLVTNDWKRRAAKVLEWPRQHANMENRIKEHKSGLGLEKLPTRKFHANWAYLLIGQLAFNLLQWFKRLILPEEYHALTVKTLRHRLLNLAGKIVRTGRRKYLVLSEEYEYKEVWTSAMEKLAGLSFA